MLWRAFGTGIFTAGMLLQLGDSFSLPEIKNKKLYLLSKQDMF